MGLILPSPGNITFLENKILVYHQDGEFYLSYILLYLFLLEFSLDLWINLDHMSVNPERAEVGPEKSDMQTNTYPADIIKSSQRDSAKHSSNIL